MAAAARFCAPSRWIFCTSVSVSIRAVLATRIVSRSTTPRSASFAVSMVPIFRRSALERSRSLVMSVTAFCALSASSACCMPSAMTIWLFHSGIVLAMVDWMRSASTLSLFCISRICGPICTDTMRVSFRSWMRFSKRSISCAKSLAACASAGSAVSCALASSGGSSSSRRRRSLISPAMM